MSDAHPHPTRRGAPCPMHCWLPGPLPPAVEAALTRLRRGPDTAQIAVMPDVHLARDVCVGVVLATRARLYPAAIGGDIGCGMGALRVPGAGHAVDPPAADAIRRGLRRLVPVMHHPDDGPDWPAELDPRGLSAPPLRRQARRSGRRLLGTLGRGNHFLELQRAGDDLWITAHSGSRALGPLIRDHHLRGAPIDACGLGWRAADSDAGRALLADVGWARAFARANRQRLLAAAAAVVGQVLGVEADPQSHIDRDHNHVERADFGDGPLWVHRKGAMQLGAAPGVTSAVGIIPGSMGHPTYHVVARPGPEAQRALGSCSHGAGRSMSRTEARRRISVHRLVQRMGPVHFDRDRAAALVEESPDAYKDISAVMRAQAPLVRVLRRLEPVLSYKGA